MVLFVIAVESLFTLHAVVTLSHEGCQVVAGVIVFSHFNEYQLLFPFGAFENHLVAVIHRDDHNLIVGKNSLE